MMALLVTVNEYPAPVNALPKVMVLPLVKVALAPKVMALPILRSPVVVIAPPDSTTAADPADALVVKLARFVEPPIAPPKVIVPALVVLAVNA